MLANQGIKKREQGEKRKATYVGGVLAGMLCGGTGEALIRHTEHEMDVGSSGTGQLAGSDPLVGVGCLGYFAIDCPMRVDFIPQVEVISCAYTIDCGDREGVQDIVFVGIETVGIVRRIEGLQTQLQQDGDSLELVRTILCEHNPHGRFWRRVGEGEATFDTGAQLPACSLPIDVITKVASCNVGFLFGSEPPLHLQFLGGDELSLQHGFVARRRSFDTILREAESKDIGIGREQPPTDEGHFGAYIDTVFIVVACRLAKGIGIEDIVSRRVVAIQHRECYIVDGCEADAGDIGKAPTLVLRRSDFAKEGEALTVVAVVESCCKLVLSLKKVGVIVIEGRY